MDSTHSLAVVQIKKQKQLLLNDRSGIIEQLPEFRRLPGHYWQVSGMSRQNLHISQNNVHICQTGSGTRQVMQKSCCWSRNRRICQ